MAFENEKIEVDVCETTIKNLLLQESGYFLVVNKPKEHPNYGDTKRLSEDNIEELINYYGIMNKPANLELIGKPVLVYYLNNNIDRFLPMSE